MTDHQTDPSAVPDMRSLMRAGIARSFATRSAMWRVRETPPDAPSARADNVVRDGAVAADVAVESATPTSRDRVEIKPRRPPARRRP